jgi:hypothetical protein
VSGRFFFRPYRQSQLKIDPMKPFLIFLLCFGFYSQISLAGEPYRDVVLVDQTIWALTSTGSIRLINAKNGVFLNKEIENNTPIVVITVDKVGNVIIADKANNIKKFDNTKQTWNVVTVYSTQIMGLAVDDKNRYYIISEKGIYDIGSKTHYFTTKSINTDIKHGDNWHMPSAYHIDINNVIWLGYDYGEWGGDLILFDTVKKQFIEPSFTSRSLELSGVHSIFDDGNAVYVSSSVHHMTITRGSLIRFTNFHLKSLFTSQSRWKTDTIQQGNPPTTTAIRTMAGGEQIGPAAYEASSDSIYFYSQNGFFRGKRGSDLSTIDKWTFIVKPTLRWSGGQRYAVGAPINVLKLFPVGRGQFYFLSEQDGIGYVNGKTLVMLRD